jgi:hypothetical protein
MIESTSDKSALKEVLLYLNFPVFISKPIRKAAAAVTLLLLFFFIIDGVGLSP